MEVVLLLMIIAGVCNGIMDSIQFHNSYSHLGYWWSLESWKMPKFLGLFVPNAWHILKYIMMLCFFVSFIIAFYTGFVFCGIQYLIIQILLLVFSFVFGFGQSYK